MQNQVAAKIEIYMTDNKSNVMFQKENIGT